MVLGIHSDHDPDANLRQRMVLVGFTLLLDLFGEGFTGNVSTPQERFISADKADQEWILKSTWSALLFLVR